MRSARFHLAILLAPFLLLACADGPPSETAGSEPSTTAEATSRAAGPTDKMTPRDVVLITIDTLRHDALGFAADTPGADIWRTPTPNLDRLAEQGRVFDFAVAHNTVTLPSHASILTGLYPYQHGVRDNAGFVLGDDIPTLATLLDAAGFATGAVVSAFVLDSRYGLDNGFDLYDDQVTMSRGLRQFQVSERPADDAVDRALAWWREHPDDRRFLWLHLYDPHAPYEPPAPFDEPYAEQPYRGEIAAVDAFLGGLLETVDAGGDEPLVILTADHGESLGDHDEITHGLFAYQATLQVPLVLRGPGIEPGRDDRLARHVDLLPTVLDMLGIPRPEELTGRSLATSVSTSADDGPTTSYFEALTANLDRGWAPLRGLIADRTSERGRAKVIDLPLPELYDLDADPTESTNVASSQRRVLRELLDALPTESAWPPSREMVSSEEAARLHSLGYIVDSAAARDRYGPEDDPKQLVDLDAAIHEFSVEFASGRLDRAIGLARKLVERRPTMPLGHTLLAQAQLEAGDTASALVTMLAAHRAGHASPTLRRQLALTLAESGRADEAIQVVEPLAAGGDPEAVSILGQVYSEAGRGDDADRTLRQALDLLPDDAPTRERAAVAALRGRRPGEALEHARLAVEIDPSLATAWNTYGVALTLRGRPAEGLEAWQRAVELDPDLFDTLYNLGVQAAAEGRPDLARRALQDFVARAPRDRYAADLPRARELLRRLPGTTTR
ncbi:MAG: sulfatase-like hydrolase/transferase [Acidobacteriota bacterium]